MKKIKFDTLIYGTGKAGMDLTQKIQLTEKQEKEQNIFLNNKRVQGETDFRLMAELIEDIDIDAAGLEEYDIEYIETLVPDFKFGSNTDIVEEIKSLKDDTNSGKDYVKDLKSKIKGDISNTTHLIVTGKQIGRAHV